MKHSSSFCRQAGTALVFSLLLLLILTLLGISSMNNTLMQERMAANTRIQTALFESASAGVSDAVGYVFDPENWPDCGNDVFCEEKKVTIDGKEVTFDKRICGHSGTSLGTDGHTLTVPAPTETDPSATKTIPGWSTDFGGYQTVAGDTGYQQRMYCLGDEDAPNNPSQLFVLTRASMQDAEGDAVGLTASREIEVRVGRRQPGDFPPPPISALNPLGTVAPGSSNSLSVIGECGPAVLTDENDDRTFIDAVRDDRIGNYEGGIQDIDPGDGFGDPWDDPAAIRAFVDGIVGTLATPDVASPVFGVKYEGEGPYSFNSETFGTRPNRIKPSGEIDMTTGDPQITYFDGDVSMGGSVSGSGILIVEGDLSWTGTPAFDGLILVLGGSADFTGGGDGGTTGSLILTDLESALADPDTSTVDLVWGPDNDKGGKGGGNQTWAANCSLLEKFMFADGLLDPATSANINGTSVPLTDVWNINCECSEITFGDPELMITSWRENIGWRDDEFFID